MDVVFFWGGGDFSASEFNVPTFRNTLCSIFIGDVIKKMEQSVPKRRHIKFRRRRIAEKKEYENVFVLANIVEATSQVC